MAESKDCQADQVHGQIKESSLKQEPIEVCETCQLDNVILPAVGWCESCDEYLCDSCYNTHCRPKKMRDHQLWSMAEMQNRKIRKNKNRVPRTCGEHNRKPLEYFCEDHCALGCSQCFIAKHRQCSRVICISDIKTNETDEFKVLEGMFSKLDERLKSNKETVERNQALVERQCDKAVTDIEEAGENPKTLIDRLVIEQIEKVKKAKDDKIISMADTERTIRLLEEELCTGQEMLAAARGDNTQLFITMKYLQADSSLLESKLQNLEQKNRVTVFDFVLNPQLTSVLKTVTELGSLKDKHDLDLEKGTDEIVEEVEVMRFLKKIYGKGWVYTGKPDAIQVSTSEDVQLLTALLYPCHEGETKVKLSVIEDGNCLMKTTSTYPKTDEDYIKVGITNASGDKGLIIKAGHKYDIIVTIDGSDSYCGEEGRADVIVKGVKFTFTISEQSRNGTNVSRGQIAGFRFASI